MQMLIRWALSAIALYLTITLGQMLNLGLSVAPGVAGATAMLIAVVALAVVNAVLRPIAALLTMPLNCATFGLFAFVINALLFWLVGAVVPGFHVKGFLAALFGSVVMSIVSGLLNHLVVSDKEKQRR